MNERFSIPRLVLVAIWFGLIAGLAEVVVVQLLLRSGVTVRLSADYAWMAPSADVLYMLAGLAAVTAIGAIRRRGPSVPAAIGVSAGILSASVGLCIESLHRGAVLFLAAGIATQVARLAGHPRARRLFVVVPVTIVPLALIVGYWAYAARVVTPRREAVVAGALPAAPAGAPNVLLLILDTVRERSTSLGDSTLTTTPALEAFSRRAVTFRQAIAPAPWTLPSHASFFTGQLPLELSANWGVSLDGQFPTLAEYLAARGYLTAGFVGNLQFATRASGLARGFIHYDDFQASPGQLVLSTSIGRAAASAQWLRHLLGHQELLNRRHAGEVTDAFLDWEAHHRGRPFFAFVNLFDAHEPYFPGDRSGSILSRGPRWTRYEHEVGLHSGANAWIAEKWNLKPDDVAVHAAAYQRAVSLADAATGRLLAELERRGVLDRTVVIIAADHGEQVGEHRLFEHINSLYLPVLQVPLLLAAPGLPRGLRVTGTVSLGDLPATVVDLAGLANGSPFPGRSLARRLALPDESDTAFSMLRQGLVRQGWYPIGRGKEMFSLVAGDRHYVRNGDGSEELYDVRTDRDESRNLAAAPAESETLDRFRTYLDRLRLLSRKAPQGAP